MLLVLLVAGSLLPVPGVATRAAVAGPAPAAPSPLRLADDTEASILASIYSLAALWTDPGEARALLAAVRHWAPGRQIVVLAGPGEAASLGAALDPSDRVLETPALVSPWPRDPFLIGRDGAGDGRPVFIARPNLQPGREPDAAMAPLLAAALGREPGPFRGATVFAASEPFHSGQILQSPDAAWVSLHSLEPAILARLGLTAVPVPRFGTPQGRAPYLLAARQSLAALAALLSKPARFVHPLPDEAGASPPDATAILQTVGGGAGFDLDSLLTLLPPAQPHGPPRALVGSLALGASVLVEAPPEDLANLAGLFGLRAGPALSVEGGEDAPPPDAAGAALRAALVAASRTGRARALEAFLDQVASHMLGQGHAVDRLPLILVPTALLVDRRGLAHDEFLLGWNNLVVERRDGRVRAEGFASGLRAGDQRARAILERLDVSLALMPPLRRSVVLNGGYRCSSNHLRLPPPPVDR